MYLNVTTVNNSNFWNNCHPQISAAFGGGGGLISAAMLIRVNTVLSGIAMVLGTAVK